MLTTVRARTEPSLNRGPMMSSVIFDTSAADATVQAANTAAPVTAVKNSRLWWRKRARNSRNACARRLPRSGTTVPSPTADLSTTGSGSIGGEYGRSSVTP